MNYIIHIEGAKTKIFMKEEEQNIRKKTIILPCKNEVSGKCCGHLDQIDWLSNIYNQLKYIYFIVIF